MPFQKLQANELRVVLTLKRALRGLRNSTSSASQALKKEASEAIAQAQAKTIDHFCRAIRVASHRQDIGLEDCGLKEAFATALANDRVVGEDSDGCELIYTAMTPELAVHLTESAWAEGSKDHLNNLLSRAAELASRSPEYLRDAEADLKKHSHRIASVNQSTVSI